MKNGNQELSIFVDESGIFNADVSNSRFYVVSFVFHDQSIDISEHIAKFESFLDFIGLKGCCFHAGPIIRREDSFRNMDLPIRRKIFSRMTAFARSLPIECKTFCIDKRYCQSAGHLYQSLLRQMAEFLASKRNDIIRYSNIKIYYDNGQFQIHDILRVALATLPIEFKTNVTPDSYRLFQVADLICTMKLLTAKKDASLQLSRSEARFFHSPHELQKNYINRLKPLLD